MSFSNYLHEMKTWKIAGINFDHMHMGDLLRLVHEHPEAEIVGICDEDPARMQNRSADFRDPERAAVHRLPGMSGEDAARHRDPLPRHRAPRRVRAEGGAVRRARPGREALRRFARRCRRDDPRGRGDRQDDGHQLAAGLVPAARDHQAPDRRGRHRRGDRGPLLRWQPRPAAARRGQGRDQRRGGGAAEGAKLVVPERRRAAARCWTTSATARRWAPGSTAAARRSR